MRKRLYHMISVFAHSTRGFYGSCYHCFLYLMLFFCIKVFPKGRWATQEVLQYLNNSWIGWSNSSLSSTNSSDIWHRLIACVSCYTDKNSSILTSSCCCLWRAFIKDKALMHFCNCAPQPSLENLWKLMSRQWCSITKRVKNPKIKVLLL